MKKTLKILPALFMNIVIFYTTNSKAQLSIKIGTQIWSAANLDVSTYRNGDPIPQVKDSIAWSKLTTGAWCYYNNDPANGKKYGKLYNWYAVNDSRGLAPKGWHIPSDAELKMCIDNLGGAAVAGAKMKNTNGWKNNGNGTNTSGLAGLPGGIRNSYNTFVSIGSDGSWWGSTPGSATSAWYHDLYYSTISADRYNGDRRSGMSVRCVKD